MIPSCGTLDDSSLSSFEMLPARARGGAGEVRYLISLDYDGTLRGLQPPHIESAFFELMEQWHGYGVRWGINTGRSLRYLLEDFLLQSRVLPDFICTCERYAYYTDVTGVLRACLDYNRRCHADHEELRERYCEPVTAAFALMREFYPAVEWAIDPSDPLSIATSDAQMMEQLLPFIYHLQGKYPELGMQRADRFMRFCDARYHKGSALRQICQHWGVDEARCFLMGDGENDLDAFRLFPRATCAAPSHAHPDVVDYVRERGGDVSSRTVREALGRWSVPDLGGR